VDFLQTSDTATDERYYGMLDRLQQVIRRKKPGFMRQDIIIITTTPVVLLLTGLIANFRTGAGRLWITLLQSRFRAQ